MKTIIEELEEQVEYWRQRAEAAEAALHGRPWDRAVAPLTLQPTRILRLLAERDLVAPEIANALEMNYPNVTPESVKVMVSKIRTKLPAAIAPPLCAGHGKPYTIPDREALRAFLGVSIPTRRAA